MTFGNRVKNATSPRSSTKITKNDNRVVSVHDVKGNFWK